MAISHHEAFELLHHGLDAALQRERGQLPAGRLREAVLAALDTPQRQRLEVPLGRLPGLPGRPGAEREAACGGGRALAAHPGTPHEPCQGIHLPGWAAPLRQPGLAACTLLAAVLLGLLWALEELRPQPAVTSSAENPVMVPPVETAPTPQASGSGWVRIAASDGQAGNLFGYWAALDGDWLAAGAPGVALADGTGGFATDRPPGAVYIFQRQGEAWVEQAKVLPSDSQPGDRFGLRVALFGDTLAVGAPYKQAAPGGNAAGAVYLFQRQGEAWSQQALLAAPDGAPFDLFGSSLALQGDTLVVGARSADLPGETNAGAVYVYPARQRRVRLGAASPAGCCRMGRRAIISARKWPCTEDKLLVGAPGRDDRSAGQNAGAVYVFERRGETWRSQGTLKVPGLAANAQFGYALSLNPVTGTMAVFAQISRPNPELSEEMARLCPLENYSGTVYVFEPRERELALPGSSGSRLQPERNHLFPTDRAGSGRWQGLRPRKPSVSPWDGRVRFFFQRQGDGWVERSPQEMSLPSGETTGVFQGMPHFLDADEQVLAIQELNLTDFGSDHPAARHPLKRHASMRLMRKIVSSPHPGVGLRMASATTGCSLALPSSGPIRPPRQSARPA